MQTLALVIVVMLVAGCAARAPAPVDERRGAPVAPAKPAVAQPARPGTPASAYVVRRGDTLYSIALEFGLDYRDLMRWNAIDDPSKLKVGQALSVTGPAERPNVPAATAGVSVGAARGPGMVESRPLDRRAATPAADPSMKTSPKAVRLPYSEQNLALLEKPEPAPAASRPAPGTASAAPSPAVKPVPPKSEPSRPEPRDPEAIEFIWPAKGRVAAGYLEPSKQGLDIAGRLGDPVVAAAPGRVIYKGSGIPGLGKFVIIKHDNDFQTVYAHVRQILVDEKQIVARGEKIAELGDTDTDAPKLHFQIRRLGKPLDPARYLPPG